MSREAFENYMALYWKLNGRWPDSEQVWQAATAEQAEQLTIAMQRIAELEKDVDILQTNLDAALRDKAQLSSEMAEAKGEFEFIDRQNDEYRQEIERLKSALSELLKDADTRDSWESIPAHVLESAKEALKGAAE